MFAGGLATTPETGEAVGSQVRMLKESLSPWRADHEFSNFLAIPATADAVLPHDVLSPAARDQVDVRPRGVDHLEAPGPAGGMTPGRDDGGTPRSQAASAPGPASSSA